MAIVSRPTDAASLLLMEDSRVPLRLQEMLDGMDEEMRWMNELNDLVWSTIAKVGEFEGGELMDETIRDAHVSVSFVQYRIVKVATRRPWSLCVGNVRRNLEELAREDEPVSDDTTNKVWHAWRGGLKRSAEVV